MEESSMEKEDNLSGRMGDLLDLSIREVVKRGNEGFHIVGHFGAVHEGGEAGEAFSWWSIRTGNAVQRLIDNPDYRVAQVLSVLGSEVRLAVLRSLLPSPKSAAELVSEDIGLRTTGQAYHHLRELEMAGYLEQRGGQYHFKKEYKRVYLTALSLAADAGAEKGDEVTAH
ncbi:MAG: winged helix-turn-helix domain-containing protein [Armatimonadetes bacterium]|nr:winged helix-turn-helix domain-containing protein [Armatimonadota bacterium]